MKLMNFHHTNTWDYYFRGMSSCRPAYIKYLKKLLNLLIMNKYILKRNTLIKIYLPFIRPIMVVLYRTMVRMKIKFFLEIVQIEVGRIITGIMNAVWDF